MASLPPPTAAAGNDQPMAPGSIEKVIIPATAFLPGWVLTNTGTLVPSPSLLAAAMAREEAKAKETAEAKAKKIRQRQRTKNRENAVRKELAKHGPKYAPLFDVVMARVEVEVPEGGSLRANTLIRIVHQCKKAADEKVAAGAAAPAESASTAVVGKSSYVATSQDAASMPAPVPVISPEKDTSKNTNASRDASANAKDVHCSTLTVIVPASDATKISRVESTASSSSLPGTTSPALVTSDEESEDEAVNNLSLVESSDDKEKVDVPAPDTGTIETAVAPAKPKIRQRKRKMSEAVGLVGARSGQLPLDGREHDESVSIIQKMDDDTFLSAYQQPCEPNKRRRIHLGEGGNTMMKGAPLLQAEAGGLLFAFSPRNVRYKDRMMQKVAESARLLVSQSFQSPVDGDKDYLVDQAKRSYSAPDCDAISYYDTTAATTLTVPAGEERGKSKSVISVGERCISVLYFTQIEDKMWIKWFATDTAYQGRKLGVGKKLLIRFFELAKRIEGVTDIYLEVGRGEEWKAAHHRYRQAGFKPVDAEDKADLPPEIKKCSDHLNDHDEYYIMHCSDVEKGLSMLKK